MSLADEIRGKFILPEGFIEKHIIPELKDCGSTCIICDHHISDIYPDAIPFQYGNSLEEWAKSNGFRVSHRNNAYGVRHIFITI